METMPWWAQVLSGSGLFVFLGGIVALFFGRKKVSAEAAEIVTGSAVAIMKRLEGEVASLREEVAQMKEHQRQQDRQITRWRTFARSLYRSIEQGLATGTAPALPEWPEEGYDDPWHPDLITD